MKILQFNTMFTNNSTIFLLPKGTTEITKQTLPILADFQTVILPATIEKIDASAFEDNQHLQIIINSLDIQVIKIITDLLPIEVKHNAVQYNYIFPRLPNEALSLIFSGLDTSHSTGFMSAVESGCSGKASDFIHALNNMPTLMQELVLTHQNKFGANVLMLAIYNQFSSLSALVEIILKLSLPAQEIIFTQENYQSDTVLMIAAETNPELLPGFYPAFQKFNPSLLKSILTCRVRSTKTVLTLMLENRAYIDKPLLAAIDIVLVNLFKLKTDKDTLPVNISLQTLLKLAIQFHPNVLPSLLNILSSLPPYIQNTIIVSGNKRSVENLILIAAKSNPFLLTGLFNAISEASLISFFTLQVRAYNGFDTLERAIKTLPDSLTYLFDAVKTLPLDTQLRILTHAYPGGYNLLSFFIKYRPEQINIMLSALSNLSIEQKEVIFSQKTASGETIFNWADINSRALLEKELLSFSFRFQFFTASEHPQLMEKFKQNLVSHIEELKSSDSFYLQKIYEKLHKMGQKSKSFYKQALIIDAVEELKRFTNPELFSEAIMSAIVNPDSRLALALNTKRNPFVGQFKEASTYAELRNLVLKTRFPLTDKEKENRFKSLVLENLKLTDEKIQEIRTLVAENPSLLGKKFQSGTSKHSKKMSVLLFQLVAEQFFHSHLILPNSIYDRAYLLNKFNTLSEENFDKYRQAALDGLEQVCDAYTKSSNISLYDKNPVTQLLDSATKDELFLKHGKYGGLFRPGSANTRALTAIHSLTVRFNSADKAQASSHL